VNRVHYAVYNNNNNDNDNNNNNNNNTNGVIWMAILPKLSSNLIYF
jgi:hypothetical protein